MSANVVHQKLYDYDDQVMIINDWSHVIEEATYTKFHHFTNHVNPETILVNGLGRVRNFQKNESSKTPLAVFKVIKVRQDSENVRLAGLKEYVSDDGKYDSFYFIFYLLFFQGKKNRVRVIQAASQGCPIQISISNHSMLVISLDGNDIEPYEGINLCLCTLNTFIDMCFVLKSGCSNHLARGTCRFHFGSQPAT